MPYRRLPNTDQARISALKKAADKLEMYPTGKLAVSYKALTDARNFLVTFVQAHNYYKQCFTEQVNSNRKYQHTAKMVRLYISHFIQVLNLATVRSEIKEECKSLYGLIPKDNTVPDLTNESSILEWGEKIIRGEKERMRSDGVPIYNPTIAKVSVHYELFKEGYEQQKSLQKRTSRSISAVAALREKADRIILEIWNQTEKSFEHLSGTDRLDQCRAYGVIYYYRTGENKPQ